MRHFFKDGWDGGRKPTLWIVKGGKIYRFAGEHISGVVGVSNIEEETQVGVKTYTLNLAKGAVPCLILASPHGRTWPVATGEEAYKRFKKQFGVRVPTWEFTEALMRDFPMTYERLIEEEENPWPEK